MAMVVRITDAEWVSMRALASMGVYRSVFGFVAVAALVLCGLTDIAAVGEQAPERKQVQPNTEPAIDGTETSRVVARGVAAQLGGLDQRIAKIQETANWGFVTRDFIQKIESRQAELKGVPISVSGIIRDDRQQPVHGAFIVLRLRSNSSLLHGVHGRAVQDVFAVAWTDAEGKFHFHQQPTPWFEPAYPLAWEICVFASGFATAVRTYEFLDQRDRFEGIELVRESVIEGTIKDVEGNPVTHIGFAHVDTVNPYDASLDLTLLFSEMMHYVRPDQDGRIRIGGLPPQRIANLIPEPTANRLVAHIATSSDLDPDRVIAEGRPRSNIVHPYINSPFEVVVTETAARPAGPAVAPLTTRTISIRVIDADTGKGVSNVGVGWAYGADFESPRIHPGMEVTDSDGNALLTVPKKPVNVFVGGRRFGYVTKYGRMSTNPDEFTPAVDRQYWVRTIDPESEERVTFELRSVPPLDISVQYEDGSPVAAAELAISQEWSTYYLPPVFTDARGNASVSVRPVMFEDVKIVATTVTGLQGTVVMQLSKDLSKAESAVIVIK